MTVRQSLVAVVLAATLAVVVTWPLFAAPATRLLDAESIYGASAGLVQRDINLTLWVLAWDCHALGTNPARLFHANDFYPAPYSLALSEHMLGNVPLFCPVYAATGNPVLAHQIALLATFVIAALAMQAYVMRWTGDAVAAIAAGLLYAFAPYRVWQVGNLHVVSIHWLPLVPLGIDWVLDGRRMRGAVALAVGLIASTACSYYVGYAAFALAAVYGAVRAASVRDVRSLGPLVLAGVAAVVVIAAITTPYLLLQRQGVIPARSEQSGFVSLAFLGIAREGPLGMASFFLWPRKDGVPLYLTLTVAGIASLGVLLSRRTPRGALVATAVTGFVLVLGPTLWLPGGTEIGLPYRWLAAAVPGFSAMRVPQRLGAITAFAVVALAGLGLAALRVRWRVPRPRLAAVAPVLVVALALFEGRPRRLRTLEMAIGETMPTAHRWLAAHGDGGALIELPIRAHKLVEQSTAVYHSTAHWLPIANGYAPYVPETFTRIMDAAGRLPEPAALDAMLAVAPLRWLVVNRPAIDDAAWPAWQATFAAAGLTEVGDFGDTVVFEVPPARR